MLVKKTKRSSAALCDGDVVVFGGAGVKTKEGHGLSADGSELVYVFNEVCQNDSELHLNNVTKVGCNSPLKAFCLLKGCEARKP